MSEALYNTRILALAAASAGLERLAAPQASVMRVSPVCGSKVTADITLDAEGRVAAHGWQVRACALGQSATTLVADTITGKTASDLGIARAALADWLAGTDDTPPDWPGLEIFAPARPHRARHGSILLAFDAAHAAAVEAAIASPAINAH